RRGEEGVDGGRLVEEADDFRALLGEHGDAELVVLERQRGPAGDHPVGSVSRMNQFAVSPQSTVRLMPVIPDASSEARKANAAATSAGFTRRRIATRSNWPFRYSMSFGPTAFSVMSVCVNPGLTAFTRMACCASSSAIVRLR